MLCSTSHAILLMSNMFNASWMPPVYHALYSYCSLCRNLIISFNTAEQSFQARKETFWGKLYIQVTPDAV